MPYINGTRYSPRIYLSGAIGRIGLSIGRPRSDRRDIVGLSTRNFRIELPGRASSLSFFGVIGERRRERSVEDASSIFQRRSR